MIHSELIRQPLPGLPRVQVYPGLLDGVKIGPPTRTRVTPGKAVSDGNMIVG